MTEPYIEIEPLVVDGVELLGWEPTQDRLVVNVGTGPIYLQALQRRAFESQSPEPVSAAAEKKFQERVKDAKERYARSAQS